MGYKEIEAEFDNLVKTLEPIYGASFLNKFDAESKKGILCLMQSLKFKKIPSSFKRKFKRDGYVAMALIFEVLNCYETEKD